MPAASELAASLRSRLDQILGKGKGIDPEARRTLPSVTIGGNKPNAPRSSINKTAVKKLSFSIESAAGKVIPICYGPCSQPIRVFAVGKNGNNLVMGGWFALGEIEEITTVYINEVDASTISGVTVTEYTGTTSQTTDSTLSAALTDYTHTLVLSVNGSSIGVAYLVFEIEPGALDTAPSSIEVRFKGLKNIEDTRTSTTAYSDLPPLQFRNWLKSAIYGPGLSVDDDAFEDLADHCETVPADDWVADTAYELGDFVKETGANANMRMHECTSAGTSDSSEPSPWDDDLGDTTTDNDVEWTCRDGRRHVCGMEMETAADVESWIETWRTACGMICFYNENGLSGVPDAARATDHTFTHAGGDFPESPGITWSYESLANTPTVVRVVYTDTSAIPWRDGTDVEVKKSGVDAGTVPYRLSTIYARWINRKSEAMRLGTKRINAYELTNLKVTFPLFDEGLEVCAGDTCEITHPVGFTSKKLRVLDNSPQSIGRYLVTAYEYDALVYSNHLETEPSSYDFGLNDGTSIPKVFTSEPTTPYKLKDIWMAGETGDIKICTTARTSGAYTASDWELASEYTKTAKNLQFNGDFEMNATAETDPTHWDRSLSGTPQYSQVYETVEAFWPPWAVDGHCFYAKATEATSYTMLYSDYYIPVTQDTYYCLSAWIKTSVGRCFLGVNWYDKDKNLLSYDHVCMNDYQASNDWEQKISDPFKPSEYEATAKYVKIRCLPQYQKIGYTMISRIQFVEARNPIAWESSYSVAPGSDKTGDNTAADASAYTGASISTTYTAAKCEDADADETAVNTANNTDHINDSECDSGHSVTLYEDILAYNESSYKCYYSSTYKGGLYAKSDGIALYGVGDIGLSASTSITISSPDTTIYNLKVLSGAQVDIGNSGSTFQIHLDVDGATDEGSGIYRYDGWIT